ncbi:MAG: hypothetical protein IT329_22320 [Caldilineaceae bacterium]|nr:hypothetical protein [Caldilineaceae bacterium]
MSGQNRRKTRLMALLALSLLLLPMVTCTQPDPSPRTCAHWGGRYQYYQWPDLGPNAGAVSGYCVFGDGTVCNPQQLRDGTCTPANPLGPLSPLAYPKREFPPIHSPFATPLSPLSPEEIVSKASLIFIGEIGEVQQRTEFAVYTQDGQIESYVTDAVGNPLPNIPITDFLLTVVQVIRDDGAIASGQLIVLRLIGSVSPDMKNLTKDTEFPISFTGDRHLFLLTPNPDGQTYGLRFGPWSRLTLDGGVLHVSNGEQEPFKLAGRDEPASLEEFVAFVATQPLPGQPPAGTMELPSVPYSPLATPEVVPTSEISLYVPIGLGGSITETQPMGEVGMSAPVSPLAPPSNVGVFIGGGGVMAYPRSFEELVDSAALIVLGKVGPVVQYLDLGGYGGSDGKQPMGSPTDPTSMMLFGWPVTDLLIEVEQVIRDDGSIAAGKPIILRILGFATAESKKLTEGGEFPLSYTGDQHLFLLGANPDGTYGLTFGPRSRLIVDGDILRVSDGTQQPLLFVDSTGPISLDDLIAYVETGTLPVKENTLGLLAVPDVPIEPETTLFVDAAARRSDYLAVWPPQSLAALIKHAPLIFIGKVGPVHEYLDFYSYGEDGELILNALPEGRGPTPAYPATEFLLEVETVIRDDGTISGGEPIILQVVGHITEESKRLTQADAYPVSYTGDRHLFMLTSNVDGRSWVLEYGPWSRLIVDGDILRISDCEQSPLRFGADSAPVTLEELIQVIAERP